jgi:hypothetical protein
MGCNNFEWSSAKLLTESYRLVSIIWARSGVKLWLKITVDG